MSKKLTAEKREKLVQKLIVADLDFDPNILTPSKKPIKSLYLLKSSWRFSLLGLSSNLFGVVKKFFIKKNGRREFSFQILSIAKAKYDKYR